MNLVTKMKAEFDATFAEAEAPRIVTQDFLTLRVASDHFALGIDQLAGIHRDRTVRTVPGRDRRFLGLAAVRGALVSVFDLGTLLGYAPDRASLPWIVLVRAPSFVALAFDVFDRHVRLPPERVVPAERPSRHVRGVIDVFGVPHSLIDVPSLLGDLPQ